MTMERMKSAEGRKRMQDEIDTLEFYSTVKKIREVKERIANLNTQLQEVNLDEVERVRLKTDLEQCTAEEGILTLKKLRLQARLTH